MITADGQVIGKIDEIYVDSNDWRVESIRVDLRNEIADKIGIHRSVFRHGMIEVPVRLVQSFADTLVLNVALDNLRPAVDTTTSPGPAPAESAPFH